MSFWMKFPFSNSSGVELKFLHALNHFVIFDLIAAKLTYHLLRKQTVIESTLNQLLANWSKLFCYFWKLDYTLTWFRNLLLLSNLELRMVIIYCYPLEPSQIDFLWRVTLTSLEWRTAIILTQYTCYVIFTHSKQANEYRSLYLSRRVGASYSYVTHVQLRCKILRWFCSIWVGFWSYACNVHGIYL